MRVKSVNHEKAYSDLPAPGRYAVRFEHNGVTWEKFLSDNADDVTLKNWLNSLIEDTIARHTKWDK